MVQVHLPPGCKSLAMGRREEYTASRGGGTVNVTHSHAVAIDKMPGNGDAGLGDCTVQDLRRDEGRTHVPVLGDHLELVDEDLS